MLIKYSSPVDYELAGPYIVPVRLTRAGLGENDRKALEKTASPRFVSSIREAAEELQKAGQYPAFIVSHGGWETYGCNRNGDGFDRETNRGRHHTFVKSARLFRNHRNRPDQGHPHYGDIRKSHYDEGTDRVELLAGYNRTKEAAERNGGKIADREIETLESGKLVPTSMGCKVAHDVCTHCGNRAKTRADYCTAETCGAGGCKTKLGQVVKLANGDVTQVGVLNPGCTWFDMSSVGTGADPQSFGVPLDYLSKTAAYRSFDELRRELIKEAELRLPPIEAFVDDTEIADHSRAADLAKLAHLLASVEACGAPDAAFVLAFQVGAPADLRKLGAFCDGNRQHVSAKLARNFVVLSLPDFAAWSGRETYVKEASTVAPALFDWFLRQPTMGDDLTSVRWRLREAPNRPWYDDAAIKHAFADSSYDVASVSDRAMRGVIAGEKTASTIVVGQTPRLSREASGLARDYACYKLAALAHAIETRDSVDSLLLTSCALAQNLAV